MFCIFFTISWRSCFLLSSVSGCSEKVESDLRIQVIGLRSSLPLQLISWVVAEVNWDSWTLTDNTLCEILKLNQETGFVPLFAELTLFFASYETREAVWPLNTCRKWIQVNCFTSLVNSFTETLQEFKLISTQNSLSPLFKIPLIFSAFFLVIEMIMIFHP